MSELSKKKCVPGRGGLPPLSRESIGPLLAAIPGWTLVMEKPPRIRRELQFKDFKGAIGFVNRLADLAEAGGHHPNIALHDWNKVTLELTTHKIGGLHENDFILAAKIDRL